VYTALVTPFTEDGSAVDWEAYAKLIERQVAAGVAGVVPVRERGRCAAGRLCGPGAGARVCEPLPQCVRDLRQLSRARRRWEQRASPRL
jgi:hypothetical protein